MTNRAAWAGWIVFAGVMLLVTGAINIIEGIVALVRHTQVVVTADRLYLVNLTTWGWTLLIFGVVLGGVGFGLLLGQTWARILAIAVVCLHAIAQVLWIGAYPIWSLMMLGLDTVVLFALTARWPGRFAAMEEQEDVVEYRSSQHAADTYPPVPR